MGTSRKKFQRTPFSHFLAKHLQTRILNHGIIEFSCSFMDLQDEIANKCNKQMLTKHYLRQYPSLYVCPFLQCGLGSEIFIDSLLVMKTLPLTLRLKLPFSMAASIRLPIFLATFVPSSPIIIWPSLVSFASMPPRSTVIVKQKTREREEKKC